MAPQTLYLGCFAVLIVAAQAGSSSDDDSAVMILTDSNFDVLTSEGSWILDFYAPWCGHCRRLEPEFEKAAKTMNGVVKFGKIDCTRNSALKSRFKIRGFPTLKFMRDGLDRPYRGGRKAEDFESFAKRVSGPAIVDISIRNSEQMMDEQGVIFAYLGSKDDGAFDVFSREATKNQGIYAFAKAHDKRADKLKERLQVSSSLSAQAPLVVYLTKGDKAEVLVDITQESLITFIKDHKFALIAEINANTFGDIAENGKLVNLVVEKSMDKSSQTVLDMMYPPALALKSQYLSAKIDGKRYEKFLTRYSITNEDIPCVLVVDFNKERYWKAPSDINSSQNYEEWLVSVEKGDIAYTPLIPWWNPRRPLRMASKFMKRFSDTQIMIIMILLSLCGAGCLFLCFSYLDVEEAEYLREIDAAMPAERAKNKPKAE
mmetsp:Transcript_6983/g.12883  ORF Transcript_6983/g.12883 Transcript_6983/m.12883 type:complete len:430 (+) Transcript_6983:3-1292(+)